MYRKRICVICGNEFTPTSSKALTCSTECSKIRHHQKDRNSRGVKETERICDVCGNTFMGKGNKNTCSTECQKERNHQRQILRQRQHDKSKKGICKNCGKEFWGKEGALYCSKECAGAFRQNYRICFVCGKKFPCSPSDNKLTCSPECWKIRHAGLMSERGMSDSAKEKISIAAKKKGFTDNLKKGVPASMKSPKSGKFETNVSAKEWMLKSPEGKIYKCRNLKLWARKHCGLFGFEPNEHNASKISHGIYNAKRGTLGKRTARSCTYKGWIVIMDNETTD